MSLSFPSGVVDVRPWMVSRSAYRFFLLCVTGLLARTWRSGMKKLLVTVLVLTMPQGLWAQNTQTDWHELSQLPSGERIRVVDSSHKKHSGAFSSFSDQSIILRGQTGEETIPRENILRISRSKRSYRLRNVVVSGLAGAGVGAAIGYGTHSKCQNCIGWAPTKGQSAAIGAALGFLGSLAVGAIIPSRQTIYRALR